MTGRTLVLALVALAPMFVGCGTRLTKAQKNEVELHLDQAMLYFQYGQMVRANDQFQRVLRIDKENYAALVGAGYCAAATAKYGEGAKLFEAARDINDDDPVLYMGEGMLYFEWGRKEGAHADTLRGLARSYSDPKIPGSDPDRAKAFAEEEQKARTVSVERLELARDMFKKAEALYDADKADSSKKNGYLLRMLALSHASLGQEHFPIAIRYLAWHNDMSLSLRREFKTNLSKQRPKMSDEELQAAKATLESMSSQERKTRIFKAFLHYELGAGEGREARLHQDEALAEMDLALKLIPDSPNIHLNKAQLYSDRGEYAKAKAELQLFLKKNLRGNKELDARARQGLKLGGNLRRLVDGDSE